MILHSESNMGHPKKGTPQYRKKLRKTRQSKRQVADAKFLKTLKGKRVSRALHEKLVPQPTATEAKLEEKIRKCNAYIRELVPLRAQVAS